MVELYLLGGFGAVLAAVVARSAIRVIWRRVLRPKVKGRQGENRVRRILNSFTRKGGRTRNDILIPSARGTTQIDHLLITKKGLFVVETKNYSGVVQGTESGKMWTQSFPGSRTSPREFFNPILQNKGHIRALKSLLNEYKNVPIHSIVVFPPHCSFPRVPGVVSTNELKTTIDILSSGVPEISNEDLDKITSIIETSEIHDRASRVQHNLKAGMYASSERPSSFEMNEVIRSSQHSYVDFKPVPQQSTIPRSAIVTERTLLTDTHAKLTIRGQSDTIEGFFEKSKRRNDGESVPLGGNFDYFICPFTKDKFPASEAINFYQGLWITYLNRNPSLVDFMKNNGTENLGNSFRCTKVLRLYTEDKEVFSANVRGSVWYQNMAQKQNKKIPLNVQIQSAASKATESYGFADVKPKNLGPEIS